MAKIAAKAETDFRNQLKRVQSTKFTMDEDVKEVILDFLCDLYLHTSLKIFFCRRAEINLNGRWIRRKSRPKKWKSRRTLSVDTSKHPTNPDVTVSSARKRATTHMQSCFILIIG